MIARKTSSASTHAEPAPFFGIGCAPAPGVRVLRNNLVEAASNSENGRVIVHFTAGLDGDGQKWCPDCRQADPVLREELTGRANLILSATVTRLEWNETTAPHPYRTLFGIEGVPCLAVYTRKGIESMPLDGGQKSVAHLKEAECADQATVSSFLGKHWPTMLLYKGMYIWSHLNQWQAKPMHGKGKKAAPRLVSVSDGAIDLLPTQEGLGLIRPCKIFIDRVLSADVIYPDDYTPTGEKDPTKGEGFSVWAWGNAEGYSEYLWHRHDFIFQGINRAVLHFLWTVLQNVNRKFGEHQKDELNMRHGVGATLGAATAARDAIKHKRDGFNYVINPTHALFFKRPLPEVKRVRPRFPKKNVSVIIIPIPIFAADFMGEPMGEGMGMSPFVKMDFKMNSGSISYSDKDKAEVIEIGPYTHVSAVNSELDAARAHHIETIRKLIDTAANTQRRGTNSKLRALLSLWDTTHKLGGWALKQPCTHAQSPHPEGFNVLARAVAQKQHKMVKSLVNHGADPNSTVRAGLKSRSLLHLAVLHNDAATVHELLARKADPSMTDPQGRTALELAVLLHRTHDQEVALGKLGGNTSTMNIYQLLLHGFEDVDV